MAFKQSIAGGGSTRPVAIWAVDLFAADLHLQQETAVAIRALQRRSRLRVRPVYLSAPAPRQPAFQEWAQHRLNELASGAGLPESALLPLEVVEADERNVNSRVEALLNFAKERGSRLIILSTRARRGPARWFLGSFADTLSLQSGVPLFIVNPSWRVAEDFDEILFPTDFSRRSREAYKKVLDFASSTGLRVCIYHKYGTDIGPSWDFNLVPSPTLSEAGNDELAEIRRELEQWRKDGEAAGVSTTVELDADSGSTVESILRRAELTNCIIAMTPRSTRLEAILLGSITRQLIRESTAPVWILSEPSAAQEARPAA